MRKRINYALFIGLLAGAVQHNGIHAVATRKADHEIEPLLLERWSPRKMSGESIPNSELMRLFEAARWAPSSYNGQPWRFIYAERDSKKWDQFLNFLVPFNQGWCKDAAVLIVIVSKNTFDHNGELSLTHSFDTGAAWQNLALQGYAMGLVVHGMSGFDYDRVKKELNIPDGYTVQAMVAVGKPEKETLKALKSVEDVSLRNPLSKTVMKETFTP